MTAAITAVIATALPLGHQVRDIVVVPDLARVGRRIVALQDPNQPNVIDAVLDRVESLEQARQPIAHNSQRRSDFLTRCRVGRLLDRIDKHRLPIRACLAWRAFGGCRSFRRPLVR
jgi:hypothetical protein